MNEGVHREAMAAVDRTWLEMDQPHNPMVINAIIELNGSGGARALAQTLGERLLACPRFRQRPATDRQPPAWIEDEPVDLRYHIRIRRLGADASDADLRRVIGEELRTTLDRHRPLWRCTLFVRRRGHIAVLFRAHHAMADGVALIRLLLAKADTAGADAAALAEPVSRDVHTGPLGALIDRLEAANEIMEKVGHRISDDLHHPEKVIEQLRDAGGALAALARVLQLPETHPTALRRPLSGQRGVAWSSNTRLEPLQVFAHAHGVSLNDLFLTALAGGLNRWLSEHQPDLAPEQSLRVSIPVNLRAAQDGGLGNQFGLVLLDLPVGPMPWDERLRLCAERMHRLKVSGEARAVLIGLGAAGHLPVPLERRLVHWVAAKSAAVVSNLPGPEQALRFGGMRVTKVVFWPPQAGDIGLGVSLLSYAGRVTVGVSADRNLVADPDALVAAFEAQIQEMLGAADQGRRRSPTPPRAQLRA